MPARRNAEGSIDGRTSRKTRDVTLAEDIRRRILADITSGTFGPSGVLNTLQLAQRYGVSRTPVREALVILERAGVITVLPYRGHVVRSLSLADARDIYFMREVIETAAAEQAAHLISDSDVAALAALSEELAAIGATVRAFDERCYDFHRAIAAAAASPRLSAALEHVFSDNQRLNLVSAGLGSQPVIIAEHDAIVSALRARDADRAREAMRAHLRSLFDGVLSGLSRR
jgi:DNA-binding GntR family transcriptional regulator